MWFGRSRRNQRNSSISNSSNNSNNSNEQKTTNNTSTRSLSSEELREKKRRKWLTTLKGVSFKHSESSMSYERMEDPLTSGPPRLSRQKTGGTHGSNSSRSNRSTSSEPEEEVYLVRQSYGYCAILFSVAQCIILAVMMIECGVAPISINPMVGPYPDALSDWGGKNAVNILDDGEWWRLVTPILLHAGVIHLLCNVAVQLETGAFFEREWGSLEWCIIYITSAVGSSILSTIAMPNSVSVGSSGAVMGLFGGKLAEVVCRACESDKTPQQRVAHAVRKEQLGGTLCAVTLVMAFSFIPYVDWAAHLGGLIAGILVGIAVFSCSIKTMIWRIVWFIVGLAITCVCFGVALSYMYSGNIQPAEELRDVCGYYRQFFDDYECRCMREHDGGDHL